MSLYILAHAEARQRAIKAVSEAPDGYRVEVKPPKRTGSQNDKFHAICEDLEKSDLTWAGKRRVLEDWKSVLVSSHAVATGKEAEIVIGIEGELVSLRESTATMSKARASSLIEYAQAFCASHGVETGEP